MLCWIISKKAAVKSNIYWTYVCVDMGAFIEHIYLIIYIYYSQRTSIFYDFSLVFCCTRSVMLLVLFMSNRDQIGMIIYVLIWIMLYQDIAVSTLLDEIL